MSITFPIGMLACLALCLGATVADDPLPDPDDRPADLGKPVQVYLMLGQSNMLGFGKVAGRNDGTLEHATKVKGLYPYLVDEDGEWTIRNDVRLVHVQGSGLGGGRILHDEFLTVKGARIGPEIAVGHHLGHAIEAPVLLLKSCIGNRSLGWDLLPPGSEGYEFNGNTHAGYRESPLSWKTGTRPQPIGWYAGMQYDGDIARARKVLDSLATHYPGSRGYEVAGFFWWQGDKDRYVEAHARRYEENLVRLIGELRREFEAPDAPFVLATLGQTERGADGNDGLILDAMLAVDGDRGRHPDFKDNVATVYAHPLSRGGASNSHYGGHAETYLNVGEAMGRAMVELRSRASREAEPERSRNGGKTSVERERWEVDGFERTALIHLPPLTPGEQAPLVFAWHGHGGTARGFFRNLGIQKHWPEAIVVYPQGLPTRTKLTDPEGRRSGWASDVGDGPNRDLRFFDVMLEDLVGRGIVDPELVYSTGHSNGGGFTYTLLMERGNRLGAVAPSASASSRHRGRSIPPVPIMHLAGRNDALVKMRWQQRTIDEIRRQFECGPPRAWGDHPGCRFHPSETDGLLVTFIHDDGHRMPDETGALVARFFREQAASAVSDRTDSGLEIQSRHPPMD